MTATPDSASQTPSSEQQIAGGQGATPPDVLCKGTTKKGQPCKNRPMEGFAYCSEHQPSCAYKNANGTRCRNFTINEGEFCVFHAQASEPSSSHPAPKDTDDKQKATREFIVNTVVGGVVLAGVANYLLNDFINYYKNKFGIEYIFPLKLKDDQPYQNVEQYKDLKDGATYIRVINEGDDVATVVFDYHEYGTGNIYSSPQATVPKKQSYVDTGRNLPSPFSGGLSVSSDQPVEARSIVRLRISTQTLDVRNSQYLEFSIPAWEEEHLQIGNLNAHLILALGKKESIQQVADIPSVIQINRIYFDRNQILDFIQRSKANAGMVIIQIEGNIILDARLKQNVEKFLTTGPVENRFETTAEFVQLNL